MAATPRALFDLDGTVWDSRPGIVASLSHTMASIGLDVRDERDLSGEIGPPLTAMLANVGVPSERIDEARETYRQRYHALGVYECSLYPGVASLLAALVDEGWRLATATSKGVVATELMIDHFELRRYFSVVAAASMDSSSHSKADVIARALTGLGSASVTDAEAASIMIGDRHYDIDGARNAGLDNVGVLWGYGSQEELVAAGADQVVADVNELGAVLRLARDGDSFSR